MSARSECFAGARRDIGTYLTMQPWPVTRPPCEPRPFSKRATAPSLIPRRVRPFAAYELSARPAMIAPSERGDRSRPQLASARHKARHNDGTELSNRFPKYWKFRPGRIRAPPACWLLQERRRCARGRGQHQPRARSTIRPPMAQAHRDRQAQRRARRISELLGRPSIRGARSGAHRPTRSA